jgi:hypothetical protein
MVRRTTGDERLSYDELPIFLQDPDISVHRSRAARCADPFEFDHCDNNITARMM